MPFEDDTLGHFIAGYITGEGCFYITTRRHVTTPRVQCGSSVRLRVDRELLEIVRQAMMYSENL